MAVLDKWRHYLYWQPYFLALGTVLPKSFTRAFSSSCCFNVCEVSLQASSSLGDIAKSRCARGTQTGTQKKGRGRERRTCNDHSFIFLSYLCVTLCHPKPTISWTKSVTLILIIWYHYGPSPGTTRVNVVQSRSEMIQPDFNIVLGGKGQYL